MIYRKKIKLLLFLMICGVSALFWMFYVDPANSGYYLDSAHGNTEKGVNRSSIDAFGYSKGNCAHCHEQHASIGGGKPYVPGVCGTDAAQYELFCIYSPDPYAQTLFFCEACHTQSSPIQQLSPEYSYSCIAGGNLSDGTCSSSIREAFGFITDDCSGSSSSSGSAHCLRDIVTFLSTIAPSSWNFKAGINPCSGCHNPHRAQVDYNSNGFLWAAPAPNNKSSLSLPSHHSKDNSAWDLWGDNDSERMDKKAASLGGTYCAPYRYNSTTTREPDNCPAPSTDCSSECSNGLHLADFVSLCTDCHDSSRLIYSTRLHRYLFRINWNAGPIAGGDFHGGRARMDDGGDFSGVGEWGDLIEPYKSGGMPNYVLSCTDCHEPHGSPNEFLLRQTVNGDPVNANHEPTGISGGKWFYWCQSCHTFSFVPPPSHLAPIDPTTNCFQAGSCHRHCDGSTCSPQTLLF